ncbi:MAG: hypothetical protein DRN20_03955 [Thermoplasmata archaeon]|nr:MAG: hypothetical protein DRN20_03955 [Thermoplasmata archaeon]
MEDGGMFGLAYGVCAVFYIAWFILWILVAIWVYRDAESRGKSGALWLLIIILTGIIGLIIWLVVRPEKQYYQQPYPPQYQQEISQPPPQQYTCPYCGGPLIYSAQYGRWYCQRCNRYL